MLKVKGLKPKSEGGQGWRLRRGKDGDNKDRGATSDANISSAFVVVVVVVVNCNSLCHGKMFRFFSFFTG